MQVDYDQQLKDAYAEKTAALRAYRETIIKVETLKMQKAVKKFNDALSAGETLMCCVRGTYYKVIKVEPVEKKLIDAFTADRNILVTYIDKNNSTEKTAAVDRGQVFIDD